MSPQRIPKKAEKIREIAQATVFNEAVGPDHPFFIDFSGHRGDFDDLSVYRSLNVYNDEKGDYAFDANLNSLEKVLLFLGGMRGSGKSSELAKYAKVLNTTKCFFVVVCNVDKQLNINNLDYIDVVLLQLENLLIKLKEEGIHPEGTQMIPLESWFKKLDKDFERLNKGLPLVKADAEIGTSPFLDLFGISAKFKLGVTGDKTQADAIRTLFRNNFSNFASLFNDFLEAVHYQLRKVRKGNEVLFIIDGLEKTMTAEVRKKIVIDDSYQLEQIKAYTLFTLPLELFKERNRLTQFAKVNIFPFIKVKDQQGEILSDALNIFKQFIEKRLDKALFESEDLINRFIEYSGGSPRQLLRIIKETAVNKFVTDKLTEQAFNDTIRQMSEADSSYITAPMLQKLKEIEALNKENKDIVYDGVLQELLENGHIMEYNAGSFKRVNPLIENSNRYKQAMQA